MLFFLPCIFMSLAVAIVGLFTEAHSMLIIAKMQVINVILW